MKSPRSTSGFTLVEILVVIAIIGILIGLALGPISSALDRGQLVDAMNNGRNLTMAVRLMETDSQISGFGVGWPGDDATMDEVFTSLVEGDYMEPSDIARALRAPGVQPDVNDDGSLSAESALAMYQVGSNDPNNSVFVSTFNWDASAPAELDADAVPFGSKGFAFVTKSGEAKSPRPNLADNEVSGEDNVLGIPDGSGDDGADQPTRMEDGNPN